MAQNKTWEKTQRKNKYFLLKYILTKRHKDITIHFDRHRHRDIKIDSKNRYTISFCFIH